FTIYGEVGAECSSFLSNAKSFNRPFSYLLNVSLNPAVYGISLPVQLSFGQNGFKVEHPFNILQITPSYKWIKAYIGRTGMSMSPYGLAGIGFDGAGVELTPDFLPVSVSAMFGRLQKEDAGDSLRPPLYRRLAYGLNVGWRQAGQQVALHFFHAWENAGKAMVADALPRRNFVLAWNGRFNILDIVTIGTEGGMSLLQDLNLPGDDRKRRAAAPASPGLSFKLNAQAYGIDIAYERQGARFHSMGRFYSGGDLESVSIGYSGDFLDRWRVGGRLGWQRDNLRRDRQNRMNRLILDARLDYTAPNGWQVSASYSNFMTHTRLLPIQVEPGAYVPIEHPDSLRNTQISQQAHLRFGGRLNGGNTTATAKRTGGGPALASTAGHAQTLSFDFSFQESKTVGEQALSDYFTASLNHDIALASDSRLNAAWHAQAAYRPALRQADLYTGPSVSYSHRFLQDKSLNFNVRFQYDLCFDLKRLQSGLANLSTGIGYRFAKKHQLDLRVNLRQKHAIGTPGNGKAPEPDGPAPQGDGSPLVRTDFTGTLRYAYRF
ncbi:MAG: hypothetical protein K2H70_00840, partial [Bacteroidales bacterium]|nr:hypothetical protein [Bacteroidales bacterium]